MLRATLMLTQAQRGILTRAVISGNPLKSMDYATLAWLHLKSTARAPLAWTRYLSSEADGKKSDLNAPPGFKGPNLDVIVGDHAKPVSGADANNMGEASASVDPAIKDRSSFSSSIGHEEEDIGVGGESKKTTNTFSEMQVDQSLARRGKLGTAESIERTNPPVPTRAKAGSAPPPEPKHSSSEQNNKNEESSSGNDAATMATKQMQEFVANLPSKEQVEKYFFRVMAFLYDLTYLMGTWTVRFIDQKIIQNETVKHYWKRFHEKMEQAKKD